MRLLMVAALFPCLFAQVAEMSPRSPRQGEVLRVTASQNAVSARMNGRVVRLFPDRGGSFGLMPVPVLEKPGRYSLEILDDRGTVLAALPVNVRDARFPRQNVRLSGAVTSLKPSPGEMETVRAFRQTVSDKRYWEEPLAEPVPGCMTSPFGVLRFHNGKPTGNFHGGLDQRGSTGTPIRAVAAGNVSLARMFNIHGGTVGIDHGQGLISIYLHMSKFAVQEGATVAKGDVIGEVGSTGRSNAPHLHWSLYANGIAVNPQQWVSIPRCPPPAKARPK